MLPPVVPGILDHVTDDLVEGHLQLRQGVHRDAKLASQLVQGVANDAYVRNIIADSDIDYMGHGRHTIEGSAVVSAGRHRNASAVRSSVLEVPPMKASTASLTMRTISRGSAALA